MGLLAPSLATVVAVPIVLYLLEWPNGGNLLPYFEAAIYAPMFIWLMPAHYILGPTMGITLRAIALAQDKPSNNTD
jgi:hypothetical protein